jgi:hypothetical protein
MKYQGLFASKIFVLLQIVFLYQEMSSIKYDTYYWNRLQQLNIKYQSIGVVTTSLHSNSYGVVTTPLYSYILYFPY